MPKVISLLTDFGLVDGYVGIMHGVILSICPDAQIVDISHGIPAQNVRHAAYVLHISYPYFPKGTVHVIVVDPGVGSERRAIAVHTSGGYFVAPDNGVLSYVLAREQVLEAVELTNSRYWLPQVSATFHGRDVFSPVGAHLLRGVPINELGRPVSNLVTFPIPTAERQLDGRLRGHVLHIDRFGNIITNIRQEELPHDGNVAVRIRDRLIQGVRATYAAVPEGEWVALIGSEGLLEIAVRNGNAAQQLGVQTGEDVTVSPLHDES